MSDLQDDMEIDPGQTGDHEKQTTSDGGDDVDMYSADPDEQATSTSAPSEKTGNPPPYPGLHSLSGATSTMQHDATPMSALTEKTRNPPAYSRQPSLNEATGTMQHDATPMSALTEKTGNPPPYSRQHSLNKATGTMQRDGGQFGAQNQTTEGTAIIHQPSFIYPSLPQFRQEPDVSQVHPSGPSTQGEQLSTINVNNHTTESTAMTTDTARYGANELTSNQKPATLEDEVREEKITSVDNVEQLQNSSQLDTQDVAAIHIQIDRIEIVPQKWEVMLTKALQTLLSKTFQNVPRVPTLLNLCVLDCPFSAKIKISPSSACEVLLKMKSAPLKLRDNSEVSVHFTAKVPIEESDSPSLPEKGHEGSIQKAQEIPMTSNSSYLSQHVNPYQMEKSQQPMRVPLPQYWYLNNIHNKEIERIQKKHGVTFRAEVCVSVEETKEANSQSITNATEEFTDLLQKHVHDLVSTRVPSAPKLLGDIKSFGDQLLLSASSQNWSIIGPRTHVDSAQRILNEDLKDEVKIPDRGHWDTTDIENSHGQSKEWGAPRGIEMNIKDPVLTNGLRIHHIHWEILQKAFQKQYKDLKNKFGVDFKDNRINEDVMVTTHSVGDQVAYLELNALRALMSLHQKVVMTTMGCPLQNTSNTNIEMVKMHLKDIRDQNPSFVIADGSANGGVWMIVGLTDHLRFAISEIEKRARGPVFDEKHKQMIGCERDTEFLRPFTDGPAWNGSKGPERVEWEVGAASGGAVQKGMREQGKADWEKEKETRERGAYGSSVDRDANSSLEQEYGKKPRAAGTKETTGFEKETNSIGGIRDNSKARPGGADVGGSKEDDNCPICMDEFTNQKKLSCGHGFCEDCLRRSVESLGASCPVCKEVFGKIEGDQPNGTMNDYIQKSSLPGFRCDTIVINYNIPSGTQSRKHPKPGRPFHGAQRTAYLPDNKEGREVLALLRRAFNQKVIFTVGTSRTSGMDDCVTWNDIHHKTNTYGGPQNFGYPDDGYLKRVREELKAKGIE